MNLNFSLFSQGMSYTCKIPDPQALHKKNSKQIFPQKNKK